MKSDVYAPVSGSRMTRSASRRRTMRRSPRTTSSRAIVATASMTVVNSGLSNESPFHDLCPADPADSLVSVAAGDLEFRPGEESDDIKPVSISGECQGQHAKGEILPRLP